MKFSANLGFLWTDRPLTEAIRAAKAAGFDAVECHWPYDIPAGQLKAALEETGLPMVSLNTVRGDRAAGENGLAALPGREADARAAIDHAVAYAVAVGARAVHVMAGFAAGRDAHETFLSNLRYARSVAPDAVTLLIEPLNRHDAPGYFLRTTDQARAILDELALPGVKLMFDCYHVGRTEGDLTTRFRELLPLIGHVQFASVPDRGAPDHGELEYETVFRAFAEAGWSAPMGAEYRPGPDTDASLGWLPRFGGSLKVSSTAQPVASAPRKPEMDGGRHHRAQLGFILMSTDLAAEQDFFDMAPPGVGVHITRLKTEDYTTTETLARHIEHMADAAARLQPDVRPDVISYTCTSGSIVNGEERVFAEIRKGAPWAQPMCLVTGVVDALRELGARKLVVGTPYLDEINLAEAEFLEAKGFEVLDIQGLNLATGIEFGRVTPAYWKRFALEIDHPEADAIFLSCSGIRALEVVSEIEAEAGKPVVTSNQAQFWSCLRRAGIADEIEGYGRIFSLPGSAIRPA